MPFEYRKVTAIVRVARLEAVEDALKKARVEGISATSVRGYGECKHLLERDWMAPCARVEIFAGAARAEAIVHAILAAASTGTAGDGIVCTLPVERVWRIRTRSLIPPEELA